MDVDNLFKNLILFRILINGFKRRNTKGIAINVEETAIEKTLKGLIFKLVLRAKGIAILSSSNGIIDSRTISNTKLPLHKSRNLHHPEYWMNKNRETNEMPLIYIVEMVCDWWSFGLMQNNPAEIFDYYENNKGKYKFSSEITEIVEELLSLVQQSIRELDIAQSKEIV